MRVEILKMFYCSLPGGSGRDVIAGEVADVPDRLIEALSASGHVKAVAEERVVEPPVADVPPAVVEEPVEIVATPAPSRPPLGPYRRGR